jgi:hypothetical protein
VGDDEQVVLGCRANEHRSDPPGHSVDDNQAEDEHSNHE